MTAADHADEAHRILDQLPETDRAAAIALMCLPQDHELIIVDGHGGPVVAELPVGRLLVDLRNAHVSGATVLRLLGPGRIRPGLDAS
ncbi:MAG: hypothetical protein L0H64_23160 [Pseudonocardia sp.]|nr:hypothetical protein [Pseudonocardia sp.]